MTEWRSDSKTDAGGKPYPNESSIKLFKQGGSRPQDGVWPSDLAKYYDRLDEERGFPKAKLIQGYHQTKEGRSRDRT